MSCIKRHLEEMASQRVDEEGIDYMDAMNQILEEANQDTDKEEEEED